MLFLQGIEEEAEVQINIRIIIIIEIHKTHKIIKEMHLEEEEEAQVRLEEVQVNSEDEAETVFVEEEYEEMDIKNDKVHTVIIVINMDILKEIVMQK